MANRQYSLSTGKTAKVSKSTTDQASLGKLSFKQRLESFYTIVQPDLLSCPKEWGQRFDQIWDKFGGTVEGEQLLATKLLKKYGTTAIPFRTVMSPTISDVTTSESRQPTLLKPSVAQYPNEWYELNENELNSGCIDFLSDRFDPVAALRQNLSEVEEFNPFILSVPILDRVDQFRSYLPICDPLYQIKSNNKSTANSKIDIGLSETNSQTTTTKATNALFRHVPICFVDTVKWHETGPYSLLYDALIHQQRIRILVRYVNSIRGTLSGFVIAFDQHMNLLLRDVDEQYSPRRLDSSNENDDENNLNQELGSQSNGQAEVQRRIDWVSQARRTGAEKLSQQNAKPSWTLRQRHMSQIMVRGDVIVLIYKASEERSAWSVTANESMDVTTKRCVAQAPLEGRFGTPGSFVFPDKQRQNKKYSLNQRNRDHTGGKSNYKSNF